MFSHLPEDCPDEGIILAISHFSLVQFSTKGQEEESSKQFLSENCPGIMSANCVVIFQ